jgi:NAD(P)H dehydrogenase (quinone)
MRPFTWRNGQIYVRTSSFAEGAARMPATRVLIVVYSRYGALRRMADALVEGIRGVPEAEAHLLELDDMPIDQLRPGENEQQHAERRDVMLQRLGAADALVVGAPAYFGSMASPVKRFFEDVLTTSVRDPTDRSRPWRHSVLHDKVGAAFTASGTVHGGNEMALHSILTMFMGLGMIVVTPGQEEPILQNQAAPYGATTITGPSGGEPPSEQDLRSARALGTRVAKVAAWMRRGRASQTVQL